MNWHGWLGRSLYARWCGVVMLLLLSSNAFAQTPSPWTGVIRDDAEQASGAYAGFSVAGQHALSADGRFLVFESDRTLVAGDTNGTWDIFLRDRNSGALQRISVATDGTQGNGPSFSAAISANGRQVVFRSLASNFDPTDTNGVPDFYVRDLDTGKTTLVSIGPNGERSPCNCVPFAARLSGDGRFVLFTGSFPVQVGWNFWLRDRDADADGIFDEPGAMTTTGFDFRFVDTDFVAPPDSIAISKDARYVAFSSYAGDGAISLGYRIYLHDRQLGTTVRVDRPLPSSGDVEAYSRDPDISDNGQVAYVSNAPNLVPGDADAFSDVFVYDIASGTQSRLALTHLNVGLTDGWGTAINADGRYVAFTGYDVDSTGTEHYNVYAFDRETQQSYDVSLNTDGTRDDGASGASISADGLSIAFTGNRKIIFDSVLVTGVFVATTVDVTAAETNIPREGGTFTVDVTVPPDTFWRAKLITGERDNYVEYGTYSGVGPGTIDVNINWNTTGAPLDYHVWLGSTDLVLHQDGGPDIYWLYPDSGPTAGGTAFQLTGFGFVPGASVTFGGMPATDVVVGEGGYDLTGVTPAHFAGDAIVVVTNPDGTTGTFERGFYYVDDTPPVITPSVTGTLGEGGWYTSDVAVQWQVEDPDSEVYETICENVTQQADIASRIVHCRASSYGGDTITQVEIKRDATAPAIAITEPQAREYRQGESVTIAFSCSDATSGVASCAANQSGSLDTTVAGAFSFVVTARDVAGNPATATVAYTVKALATLDAFAATGTYGGAATLRSILSTASGPLVNRSVTFFVNGTQVGSAVTDHDGSASLGLSLAGRNAGTLNVRSEYAGDASTTNAISNATTLTIAPASLHVAAGNTNKVYGAPLPAFSVLIEGFVNGDSVSGLGGALTFSTAATAASAPGVYVVTPLGYTSSNYTISYFSGNLTITRASTSLTLSSSPNPSRPNRDVEVSAVIAPVSPGAGTVTGSVEFRDNGVVIGTATIVNGAATLSVKFKKGSHALTAVYAGDVNFTGSSGATSHETN